MTSFRQIFEGMESDLIKVIDKEFKNYGGPSSNNFIEDFMQKNAQTALDNAFRKYFKTPAGERAINSMLQEEGIDPNSSEGRKGFKFYQNKFTYQVNIDIEKIY